MRKIAALFNVTRVYNAVAAVAGMRRAIALARDYARRRVAFGKPLADHPLHAETLASMETEWRAAFMLAFHVVELLGRQECNEASTNELARLRLLIPIAKLYTAKQAVAIASEALESFGGAGYIEDTGLPRLLRDAQVLPIWEGTTNVSNIQEARARGARVIAVTTASDEVVEPHVDATLPVPATDWMLQPVLAVIPLQLLAYAIARTMAGLLLLEHADWSMAAGESTAAVTAATRWCARDLARLEDDEGPVPSPMFIG